MALTNHERVGKALDLLNQGLKPFILREFQAAYGDQAPLKARETLASAARGPLAIDESTWDTAALLLIMWEHWNDVFRNVLGHAERSLVSELRDARNKWAHQQVFSTDDTYRALDSTQRLLSAVSAADQAAEVERHKQEILRVRFAEQARQETRRASVATIEGQPAAGLRPWREIITPHPDVASGRYQQAEFAADLGQVYRGEGTSEYKEPKEFFARTFLTEGLRVLLTGALQRLSGSGGDPVVELQTNFGGGKTHSMLALYHLFSGTPVGDLAGIEPVLQAANVTRVPAGRRAVLVGTALSPGQPHSKPDGTVVRTMWGELAWQLLGGEGFALLAEADRQSVSPGSDVLRRLLAAASPCLVLIDEWVAYARQLWGLYGLPAGSFDANLSFAQALTEAARAVPRTLIVASIPASDIEIGGTAGREALSRLSNTFGRMESAWRPASAEEGFEIVRRRLFQPIAESQNFAARDVVVRAFAELYRSQPQEFPSLCREGNYERRIQDAYPIHPELFDRLYTDWSSLDKFQRTRGVLRLMAAVIHSLWERQDGSLLILPASIPIDETAVQFELTRYLEDNWVPVLEKDVDGPASLPLRLDRENPNFGRYSAARRVARTVFVGSAPTLQAAHKGLEDRSIKLGCVQPGESVATFGDALRRLTDGATHLYVDGQRYWYSTQPSVTRLAQDRAAQYLQKNDVVLEDIRRRLRTEAGNRGDFARVHICPASSGDIPDERDARLVIVDPSYAHTARLDDSKARKTAQNILESRGAGPRLYRNTLVFLAADHTRLGELSEAVRQYLAWKSIYDERETLNLDTFQKNQAQTKTQQAEQTITTRIPETYTWLLVPSQEGLQGPMEWKEYRLQGQDDLPVRAAKKLRNEEMLVTQLAGTRLRLELDRVPLWRGDHVSLKDLADYFAQYLYLPRLKDTNLLLSAVADGVARLNWNPETFAYADRWDDRRSGYVGLKTGEIPAVVLDNYSLVVKPEAALQQRRAEDEERQRREAEEGFRPRPEPSTIRNGAPEAETEYRVETTPGKSPVVEHRDPRRFHGTIRLQPKRMSGQAGTIAQEVVQHLAGLMGADVQITLEIRADIPGGAPAHVVRTVTENCRTLGFEVSGFEEE